MTTRAPPRERSGEMRNRARLGDAGRVAVKWTFKSRFRWGYRPSPAYSRIRGREQIYELVAGPQGDRRDDPPSRDRGRPGSRASLGWIVVARRRPLANRADACAGRGLPARRSPRRVRTAIPGMYFGRTINRFWRGRSGTRCDTGLGDRTDRGESLAHRRADAAARTVRFPAAKRRRPEPGARPPA